MTDKTRELLDEVVEYDPSIGGSLLRWKETTNPRALKGSMAGCRHKEGYWQIKYLGKAYLAHRVIWLLVKGEWPKEQLDHINGDRSDNRIENLRECTNAENGQNRNKQKNNKSGYVGVCWHKGNKKWCAKITSNGERVVLGYFDSQESARDAYLQAKSEMHKFQQTPREALNEETIRWEYEKTEKNLRTVALTEYGWFDAGVRFAEKLHGIGGGDE